MRTSENELKFSRFEPTDLDTMGCRPDFYERNRPFAHCLDGVTLFSGEKPVWALGMVHHAGLAPEPFVACSTSMLFSEKRLLFEVVHRWLDETDDVLAHVWPEDQIARRFLEFFGFKRTGITEFERRGECSSNGS